MAWKPFSPPWPTWLATARLTARAWLRDENISHKYMITLHTQICICIYVQYFYSIYLLQVWTLNTHQNILTHMPCKYKCVYGWTLYVSGPLMGLAQTRAFAASTTAISLKQVSKSQFSLCHPFPYLIIPAQSICKPYVDSFFFHVWLCLLNLGHRVKTSMLSTPSNLHLRRTNGRTCRNHHVGIHLPARGRSLWLTVNKVC